MSNDKFSVFEVPRIKRNRKDSLDFGNMAVNDSLHFSDEDVPKNYKNAARFLSGRVHWANKKFAPMKFVVRTVGSEDHQGAGARCYRIE